MVTLRRGNCILRSSSVFLTYPHSWQIWAALHWGPAGTAGGFLCAGPRDGCCTPARGWRWRGKGTGVNLRATGWIDGVDAAGSPPRPPGCSCRTPGRCRCRRDAGTAGRPWSCGARRTPSWRRSPVSDLAPNAQESTNQPTREKTSQPIIRAEIQLFSSNWSFNYSIIWTVGVQENIG